MRTLKLKSIYRHFKGDLYLVEDIIYSAKDQSKMVAYRALYGDNLLWCRDYEDFMSKVDKEKYPESKQEYRFELEKIIRH